MLAVFQSLSIIYKFYVPFSVVLVLFQSLSTLILIFSVEALEVLLVLLSAVVSFQLRLPLLVVNLEVGVTRLSAINNKYISLSLHYNKFSVYSNKKPDSGSKEPDLDRQ